MATIVFLDTDWGTPALAGLVFDTALLATGAVVYLRLATTLGRVLALQLARFFLYARNALMGAGTRPSTSRPASRRARSPW